MILGVDTGMGTGGWALLDERACRFVDVGTVIAKRAAKVPVTLDRVRRMTVQAGVLAAKAKGHALTAIVVERMSFPPGGVNAAAPILLSWGALIGIHAMLDPKPRLLTIAPQRWQREVLPSAGRSVDYDELAARAAEHILANHPAAARSLERMPRAHWSHAIDAAMIALCGALRPHRCERVE